MRLDLKIFLTSAVVIIVLAAVGVLSLRALGRVVSASQEITTRAVPSLSRIASAREAITRLLRLEGRAVVLGDSRYVAAWDAHAVELSDQVQRLAVDAQIPEERAHLRDASVAFARYRRLVADEQELGRRGERAQALRLSEGEARTAAERVEASLDGLRAVTHARLLAAQAEAARLEAQTWTASLVALGAAVGLALLGTGVVARQMTRSLRRLSAATAQVAAGAFREPITIRSHDEIGALARDFNLMAGQLRELETTKENFFASITHELRSPLTSIRGATDLLRDGAADPLTEKQARLADLVNQSSERLLRLVNQILEVSRLRAGLLPELHRKPLDLTEIVDRALAELGPQAAERGVHLSVKHVGENFAYHGDEEYLHQTVINLGTNAIRFTPRGGRVVVRLIDRGAAVELQVEDTGVGIPAHALPHIFDAYRQAHGQQGGTGLGLAIVHGVTQAHGGRVTVESQEGNGSCFMVLLPRDSGTSDVAAPG